MTDFDYVEQLKREAISALRVAFLTHEFDAGGQPIRLCWIQRVGRAERLTAATTGGHRSVYETALVDLRRRAVAAFDAANLALASYREAAGLFYVEIDIGECDCIGCQVDALARERNIMGRVES